LNLFFHLLGIWKFYWLPFTAVKLEVSIHLLDITSDSLFFPNVFLHLLQLFLLLSLFLFVDLVQKFLLITFPILFILEPSVLGRQMLLLRVAH